MSNLLITFFSQIEATKLQLYFLLLHSSMQRIWLVISDGEFVMHFNLRSLLHYVFVDPPNISIHVTKDLSCCFPFSAAQVQFCLSKFSF